MANVRVQFFTYEWDNHQGASGRVIEIERIITINEKTIISDISSVVINYLNQMGYRDHWTKAEFSGRGLISVSIC